MELGSLLGVYSHKLELILLGCVVVIWIVLCYPRLKNFKKMWTNVLDWYIERSNFGNKYIGVGDMKELGSEEDVTIMMKDGRVEL